MRRPLMDSLGNWTWLRRESLSLRTCQEKLPKLKSKEKKTKTNKQKARIEYPRSVGQLQNVFTFNGNTRSWRQKKKKIHKAETTENFFNVRHQTTDPERSENMNKTNAKSKLNSIYHWINEPLYQNCIT